MEIFKCKYAGDVNDEYCKSCDGVTMEIDGKSISCKECAGYEQGESVEINQDVQEERQVSEEEFMNKPEEHVEDKEENTVKLKENSPKNKQKKDKPINNTSNKENDENKVKNAIKKVSEEKKEIEQVEKKEDGIIKVVSLRYTSSVTLKKNDNYFKFTAEEEWNVSHVTEQDMQDTREKLWVTLNNEVDKQIEELNNMK